MIDHSPDFKDLAAALLKFQGLVDGVKRDGSNTHFRTRYATLEAVIDTARPGLQEAGIAFTQAPGRIENNTIEMTTMLIHAASGQWMRSTMQIALGKMDPQGVGSATTYSARYSLMATLGLPPTDDDGEGAMAAAPAEPRAAHGPEAPTESTLAGQMIAEIRRRPKLESLMRLRESPQFVADLGSLSTPDQQRVQRAVDGRRADLLKAGL
jgi:hypothetical protein